MTINQNDLNRIYSLVEPLLGQKTWDVSLGFGSFLTFEFGKQVHNKAKEIKIHGEWHLWVQYCQWVLQKDNITLVGSDSDRSEIGDIIQDLEGLKILDLRVNPDAETIISFEDGYRLHLKAEESGDDSDVWWLFMPDDNVLSINENGITVSKASEPR